MTTTAVPPPLAAPVPDAQAADTAGKAEPGISQAVGADAPVAEERDANLPRSRLDAMLKILDVDGAGVPTFDVKPVRGDVHRGVRPLHEAAVHPDLALSAHGRRRAGGGARR